jgi:hypothetical protein
MFYIIVIIVAMLLTVGGNLLFIPDMTAGYALNCALSVVVATVAVIAVDGLSALALRRLTPEKWYLPCRRFFRVSKNERNFYRSLKIKVWKDCVPELGLFTGFSKRTLKSTDDESYLSRFLLESNYGVIIHLANAALGFLIAFIPICSSPSIWIPVFSVNLILSLMPVAVLRYTGYTLLALYERSEKKKKTVG